MLNSIEVRAEWQETQTRNPASIKRFQNRSFIKRLCIKVSLLANGDGHARWPSPILSHSGVFKQAERLGPVNLAKTSKVLVKCLRCSRYDEWHGWMVGVSLIATTTL